MSLFKTPVSSASLLLLIVGLADLISTIVLLELGIAEEANPIMRALLPYGWFVFSAVKCATLVSFIVVLTWYRQRHPRAGKTIETATLLGYLAIYSSLFSIIN